MSKRRLNANKIAKQPLLKKNIAKFLAESELFLNREEYSVSQMLYAGHRGFISYNEKEMVKLLEKNVDILRHKVQEFKRIEEEHKQRGRGFYYRDEEQEKRWAKLADDGGKLLDDLVDEILFA